MDASQAPREVIPRFARFGYVAKGVTYLLMSFLALRAALGAGRPENTRRALGHIDGPLLGNILLIAVGAGLGAYALWKLYNAIANPEVKELPMRVGMIFIACVNGAVAWQAFYIALSHTSEGSDQAVHWSARAMQLPLGRWTVGIAAFITAGYGIWQIARGIRGKLDSQLRLSTMHGPTRVVALGICRVGLAARGLVFVLVGWFLLRAALHADPRQARDFGRSLSELQQQPFGRPLLAAVAFGLFAYALYEFVRARYRRIQTA